MELRFLAIFHAQVMISSDFNQNLFQNPISSYKNDHTDIDIG